MGNAQLPVSLFYWGLALAPIVVLLVLLVGLRWSAAEAGPIAMFAAAGIAVFAFRSSLETVAVAGGKGIWDAVFILYVLWPALLLYGIGERAGAFAALRQGITRFSRNELFLVLAFGWVFASFLQATAGFGIPIVVVAPLLLALGVRPSYAVAIPLIGHAWANMFGAFAVGWFATLQVIELSNPAETAFQTAILLWISNLLAGFNIAWLYGRWAAVRHAWPLVLVVSAVHGGLQLVLILREPVLSTFLAASVALLLLGPLSRWQRYSEPAEGIAVRPAMQAGLADAEREREARKKRSPQPVMGLGMVLLPYGVFTAMTIVALALSPAGAAPEQFDVGPPFPEEETGFGVVTNAEEPYSPFSPLTHPGTFLLIGALAGHVVYRARGYYQTQNEREETRDIWAGLVGNAAPASIAIVAFLVTSGIMRETGQTNVLALGISEVLPPVAFALLSNFVGGLGAFMASGNTTSNVLFAPLQQSVAAAEGLSEATIIAAQSSGGAIGTAISPFNIALGIGAIGAAGQEGGVLRRIFPWVAVVALTTGVATILLNDMALL